MADFSRQDIQFFTAMAGLVGVMVGAIAGAGLSSQGVSAPAAWTGVAGAGVGGVIAYVATTYHDHKKRMREAAEIKASLYAEIADRAGRCVNDYLEPWRHFRVAGSNPLTSERVGKFKPTAPMVLPSVSGKLGILDPAMVLAVTQFYFRLDVLAQAIESLESVCEKREIAGGLPVVDPGDQERADLIRTRLRSCFDPALRALAALDPPMAEAFDREATRVYPHLSASGLSLRDALKAHASSALGRQTV